MRSRIIVGMNGAPPLPHGSRVPVGSSSDAGGQLLLVFTLIVGVFLAPVLYGQWVKLLELKAQAHYLQQIAVR